MVRDITDGTGGGEARAIADDASPPWRTEKIPGGYVVRDANGQALAYVYSRATEIDAIPAKALNEDEARRVAINIARLPELVEPKD